LVGFATRKRFEVGVELLAHGAVGDSVLKSASLPDDPRRLSFREVEQLLPEALRDLGLELPGRQEACWIMVAFIARDIIDDRFTAIESHNLSHVMSGIGEAGDEFTQMVQLLFVVRPLAPSKHIPSIDAEIRALAPRLIREARTKVGSSYALLQAVPENGRGSDPSWTSIPARPSCAISLIL
jgi:hypothetical protein